MTRRMMKSAGIMLLVLGAAVVIGCGTPEQQAQKLFDQGKYQEIVANYPDLPIAVKAKEKIAESMFSRGDYTRVIEFFPDSPYAAQAKEKLAEAMFDRGQLKEVIAQYPESPSAKKAKEKLVGDLLAQAQASTDKVAQKSIYEQICKEYPGTAAASEAEKALAATPAPTKKKGK